MMLMKEEQLIYSFDFDDDDKEFDAGEFWDQCNQIQDVRINLDNLPLSMLIKVKRAHDCLGQSVLAKKLGISTSTLSDIERGKRVPKKCRDAVHKYLYQVYYYCGIPVVDFDDLETEEVL
jgi:DNA-binding XRE family transcriptional regulator